MEQYFATGNISKSSFPEFLSTYSRRETGEKEIASYINKLLNSSKTRHRGLTILIEAISHFSSNTIDDNVINWLKHCIVVHSGDTLKEIKIIALTRLIFSASSSNDFDKTFVSNHISKVLEMCLESTSNHNQMEVALECLTVCLKNYPNWFNPHVKKIENFLLKYLDHTSQDVVINASKAFHNLQQSGGGGLNRVNYVNNFTTSFHKLCQNVSLLLEDLAEDFIEMEDSSKTEILPYDLIPIADAEHPVDTYYKMSQRLVNCIYYLKTMLQKPFSAPKIIKPKILLSVISKGMAMHVCVDKEDVAHEEWHRSEIIKKVQIHLLYLLQLLLVWLRTNAFPFSYTISKIFVDALVRTDECTCFKVNHLYFQVLNHVYVQWINMTKGIHPGFQLRIFNTLINNIVPTSNKVSLTIDTNITKSKSKKFKRKAIEEKIVNSGNETLESPRTNDHMKRTSENNCIIALRTLKVLLSITVGNNKEIFQKLYKTTIGIALNIQAGRSTDPYNSIMCQIELFNCIVAFLEQETVSSLISIYPISRILSNGSKSYNKDISLTCEKGLRILEKICQPVCPYLTSPTIMQEEQMVVNTPSHNELMNHIEIDSVANFTNNIPSRHVEPSNDISTANVSDGENPFLNDSSILKSDDDETTKTNATNKAIKILNVQTISSGYSPDVLSQSPVVHGNVIVIDDEIDKKTVDLVSDEEKIDEVIISDDDANMQDSKDCHIEDFFSPIENSKTTSSQEFESGESEDMLVDAVNKLTAEQDTVVLKNGLQNQEQETSEKEIIDEDDEDMLASFVEEAIEN